MLLIFPVKLPLRRAVFQLCSTRPFCDRVGSQIVTTVNYVSKLAEFLECSTENADFLVRKNKKLLTVDTSDISRVAAFCKNNLKLKDVLEYPTVISLSPEVLDDRLSTLKELGCRAITARNLLLFHQFMQKTPSMLRWRGYMTVPEVFFTQTLSQLNCPDDLKLEMKTKLLDLYSSNVQLEKIKALINTIFLAWKLQCSEEVATDILKKEPSLRTKSLDNLEKVCETLLKKFELPASKVCNLPKLLTINCSNVEDILQKIPKVCGVSIHHIIKKQPLILKRSAGSVYDTACTLERHGVTEIQLLSCTKILRHGSMTISSRIERLLVVEKYDVLKTSEKFLWVVLYFNNISRIKNILEDLKIHLSLNMLLATFETNAVVKHYKNGLPPRNNMSQKRDLLSYLSVIFGDKVEAVKNDLQHNPNSCYPSVQNAQKVVRYLSSKGITKKQLQNGLDIVFYNVDVVIQSFSALPHREDLHRPFSECIKHPNLIQLLIYIIEKDHSFVANGIHVATDENKCPCDDEEEEMLFVEGLSLSQHNS